MGFLDLLGKGLQYGVEQAQKKQDEFLKMQADVENYKIKYAQYDDRRLMDMYRSYTGPRKIACGILLKERGYGNSNQ